MTANQISLRNVKELERHNLATEQLEREKNAFTDAHYQRADYASLLSAQAAQSQAAAAHRNAAVNEINAATNRMATEAHIEYEATMAGVNTMKQKLAKAEFNFEKSKWQSEFELAQRKQEFYEYETEVGLNIKESEVETRQKQIQLGYAQLREQQYEYETSQDLRERQYTTDRNQGWVSIITRFGGDILKTKTALPAWED